MSQQSRPRYLRLAAATSVASLRGKAAGTLVRDLVADVRRSKKGEQELRDLLRLHIRRATLPQAHRQIPTIPGIGRTTAAILVAKIGDIEPIRDALPSRQLLRCFP